MVRRKEDLIFIDVNPENILRKNVGSGQLDDSGFVEDLEETGISEDILDGCNGVIELDDDSFFHLQSKLENHTEIEIEKTEDFKIKPCFVRLYRSPVYFEEEEAAEIKPKSGRGRERPPKNRSIQAAKKSSNRENHRGFKKSSIRDRRSEKKKEVEVEIIEIDLVDDEESETEERRQMEVERRRLGLRDVKKPEELSEYERIREENIKERLEMLRSLGLHSDLRELKNSLPARKTEKRKRENFEGERRKSARLSAREDDDDDYLPPGDQQDPEDQSEFVGVRRHPCKECANCLKPDCRRCIFCRDKKKFGGRNIKRQRCEFKERCSNPIINGAPRLLSCAGCEEQFEQTYQLELHKEKVHHIQQVRRRSSRLNTIKKELEDC